MSTPAPSPTPFAGVNATWNFTLGSIVFLFVIIDALAIPILLSAVAETSSGVHVAIVLVVVAAAAARVRYCWFLRDSGDPELPQLAWTLALWAPAVAAWILAFFAPDVSVPAAAQLWFSGVLFSLVLPKRLRWQVMAAALGIAVVPVVLGTMATGTGSWEQIAGGPTVLIAYFALLLPFMVLSSLWLWRVVQRLDDARALAAELAVTQERLRFAADLHDIQGHHLQVIALKAELVERTLADRPDYAAGQVGEIRLIAKEAMEETWSLVAGLREVGLGDELENAREVLTLAGAACDLRVTAMPEGAAARALAFAVREATTNILRHSAATTASITLRAAGGGSELVVENNGRGADAAAAAAQGGGPGSGDGSGLGAGLGSALGSGPGSGLAGLRDRVAALGGTLDARGAGDRFVLQVWVPGEAR